MADVGQLSGGSCDLEDLGQCGRYIILAHFVPAEVPIGLVDLRVKLFVLSGVVVATGVPQPNVIPSLSKVVS